MMKTKKKAEIRKVETGRGGRPSRQAAEQLGEKILDCATDLFFMQGYGATSIEAIAGRAGISKRTFYHRFEDKAAVFKAVLHRVVEQLKPSGMTGFPEGKNAREVLDYIAPVILHAVLRKESLALHRLLVAESKRFPELARAVEKEGSRAMAIQGISRLLQQEVAAGRLKIEDTVLAAEQFMQMLVSLPQRRALGLGELLTEKELENWARVTVNLFLNGYASF